MVIPPVIDNVIVGGTDQFTHSAAFTIFGEPVAQNGWSIRWRGLRVPIIFDPLARHKRALRQAIRDALTDVVDLHDGNVLIAPSQALRLVVTFHLGRYLGSKDLDNMAKFLLDSLEGVLYANDTFIVELMLVKKESLVPSTDVGIAVIAE